MISVDIWRLRIWPLLFTSLLSCTISKHCSKKCRASSYISCLTNNLLGFRQLQDFDVTGQEMMRSVATSLPLMKTLVVQSEDARCLRDTKSFRSAIVDMHRLNQDLADQQEKRRQTRELYLETLKETSCRLQAIANLYLGTLREKILQDCRESLKQRKTSAILSILKDAQEEAREG